MHHNTGFSFMESKNVRLLLDYIENKAFAVGDRLPTERILSAELGIGRNSLREAMKSLESVGVVCIRQGSGTYLKKTGMRSAADSTVWLAVHRTEILNMITVREALDLRAIELIPEERYSELRAALRKSIDEARAGELNNELMLAHDLAFHNIIREASGNDILVALCVSLTNNIYDERRALFQQHDRLEQSLEEHRRIANAFGSGDINEVRGAYIAHLTATRMLVEQAEAGCEEQV